MPGRSYSTPSYRYGFNGKEKDDEVKSVDGSQYDYGFRIYNPRLGKFLSVDPLTDRFPFYSPYQFASNSPIIAEDLDGLESSCNLNSNENSASEPFKGSTQPVDVAEHNGSMVYGQSKASESFQAGNYDVLPNYVHDKDGKEILSHYTASVQVNDLTISRGQVEVPRIDWVIPANEIDYFKANVGKFESAANVLFGSQVHLPESVIKAWNDNFASANWSMLKEQWSNPYNILIFAHAMSVGWPQANQVDLGAPNYRPVAARSAAVKDPGVLGYLQKRAPGDWLKIYEAAYLNEKQVEVHYFVHKSTGQYFDSKIKQMGWSEQFTKGKSKITGQ